MSLPPTYGDERVVSGCFLRGACGLEKKRPELPFPLRLSGSARSNFWSGRGTAPAPLVEDAAAARPRASRARVRAWPLLAAGACLTAVVGFVAGQVEREYLRN